LTAPYDAVVVSRQRELGSATAPSEPIFTLMDPATVWALAYVDEGRAGMIREGQPAELRLRSLPGEVFPARVVRIGLESDRITEERRIYARCERCPPRPVLGEQVQVEVETARLASARLVPEVAVEGFDGASGKVWVIRDGALHQQAVRFVARTLDARLALAPEFAALAVVTRLPHALREGQAARAE
jgi:HlyD family secretion protein